VSRVKYELGFYVPEDGILLSHTAKTSNLTISLHCKLLLLFVSGTRANCAVRF
jgi:hypothetical protein